MHKKCIHMHMYVYAPPVEVRQFIQQPLQPVHHGGLTHIHAETKQKSWYTHVLCCERVKVGYTEGRVDRLWPKYFIRLGCLEQRQVVHIATSTSCLLPMSTRHPTCTHSTVHWPYEEGAGQEHTESDFDELDSSSWEGRTGAGNKAENGGSFIVLEVHLSLCL